MLEEGEKDQNTYEIYKCRGLALDLTGFTIPLTSFSTSRAESDSNHEKNSKMSQKFHEAIHMTRDHLPTNYTFVECEVDKGVYLEKIVDKSIVGPSTGDDIFGVEESTDSQVDRYGTSTRNAPQNSRQRTPPSLEEHISARPYAEQEPWAESLRRNQHFFNNRPLFRCLDTLDGLDEAIGNNLFDHLINEIKTIEEPTRYSTRTDGIKEKHRGVLKTRAFWDKVRTQLQEGADIQSRDYANSFIAETKSSALNGSNRVLFGDEEEWKAYSKAGSKNNEERSLVWNRRY